MSTSLLAQMHLMQDLSAFAITCALLGDAQMIPGVNICVKVNVEKHKQLFNHGAIPRLNSLGCRGATAAVGRHQVVGGTHGVTTCISTDTHGLKGDVLGTEGAFARIRLAWNRRCVKNDL